MSYSVKFSPIYGMYNGTTYEFNWPNELSERNQLLIQNIVYDYNKLAFNIEKALMRLWITRKMCISFYSKKEQHFSA